MTGAERRLCEQAKRVYGPFYEVRRGSWGWMAGGPIGGVFSSDRRHLADMLREMPGDDLGWRLWVRLLPVGACKVAP